MVGSVRASQRYGYSYVSIFYIVVDFYHDLRYHFLLSLVKLILFQPFTHCAN